MIKIKKLNQDEIEDFKNLIEVFKIVFEMDIEMPHHQHLSKLLSNSDFWVFVVRIEGEVVGGLTVYVLHLYYRIKPTAYIYDVGIAPAYQGQGLGKKLMETVCHFCKANGFEEAYVEAEEEDKEAICFYRKTKFNHEVRARYLYLFK